MVAARKKGLKAKLVPAQVNDEGDIQRTLDELLDHFRNAEVFVSPANDMAPDMIWKMFDVEGQDMGVTEYKNKLKEDLEILLGFPGSRPLLFSKFLCTADSFASSWDAKEGETRWEVGGEGMAEIQLGWHQLVAIASLADHTFGSSDPLAQKTVTNMLLADDVGVGKTAEVMGYLAFVMMVWASEANSERAEGKGRPPIVAQGELILSYGLPGRPPSMPHHCPARPCTKVRFVVYLCSIGLPGCPPSLNVPSSG